MSGPRFSTATAREAAKRAGSDVISDDTRADPPAAQLADQHEHRNDKKPRLKHLGGSDDDRFNIALAEWTLSSSWITTKDDRKHLLKIVGTALGGIAPRDEVEGMLASQLVATYQASIECHRRAMHPEQTIEGRAMNLKFALKASTTYATLLDALNKHRGKGQQKVTVEHVHVYPGGQAIVGQIEDPRGRGEQEMRQASPMHLRLSPRCGARTRNGCPCRGPAMKNGKCRLHGGSSPGGPMGSANGRYVHGNLTCEAISQRQRFRALMRSAREAIEMVERS